MSKKYTDEMYLSDCISHRDFFIFHFITDRKLIESAEHTHYLSSNVYSFCFMRKFYRCPGVVHRLEEVFYAEKITS